MSQYRVTYQHRDREFTRDVSAFSEAEAAQVFKHSFGRGVVPLSIELIDYPPERKTAPANPRPFLPARHRGTEAEFKGVAEGLKSLRERLAANKKP